MAYVNPAIFKKYDIRGVASGDDAVLTKDAAFAIGQGIGTFFYRHHQVTQAIIGRDNRHTSYDLQTVLMDGLRRAGIDVIDIGLVSTPLVYWHAVNAGDCGGVMITGSHLTPEYNGFKLSIGGRTIFGRDLQLIYKLITDANLMHGKGEYQQNTSAYSQYIQDITARITIDRRFRVAFDPGNGTAGVFIPRLLELWGQDASGINVHPDGNYPNHQPDPQKPRNMHQLGEKVRAIGADIGFGYDGDADRVGVVDERGELIAADRILALLAQDMLQRQPQAAVVADVLSSQTVFDAVTAAGGTPHMAASGHSLVKERMREKNALLGGEMSGHMFFGEDYFGFDDAFFATGRILQLLAASDQTLSALNATLPTYYSTPEYRPHCPDDQKATVIAGIQAHMTAQGYDVVTVDGVRVQFDQGWGIVRQSNTEPVLSLRFEGLQQSDALAYRDLFIDALKAYPQVSPIDTSE